MPVDSAELDEAIADVRSHLASIDRDWSRLPWVALLLVLGVPARIYVGWLGAFVMVVMTAVIAGISAYIITGHRLRYTNKLRELEAERRRLA